MTVSVDPSSAAPLARAPAFLDWVAGAGLLLPNADEARVLTGEADPERAARALAGAAPREVVVTLGAAGALWSDGERVLRAAAVAGRGGRHDRRRRRVRRRAARRAGGRGRAGGAARRRLRAGRPRRRGARRPSFRMRYR